ncbi:uncharacterized protein LOC134453509 [Engraulis encrasicolus]|uniref:uncharacterized protein LOC134453509 n=1 Tax=Engraulis encrasicolus TaxID=184585 RepID=UPI002FCE7455
MASEGQSRGRQACGRRIRAWFLACIVCASCRDRAPQETAEERRARRRAEKERRRQQRRDRCSRLLPDCLSFFRRRRPSTTTTTTTNSAAAPEDDEEVHPSEVCTYPGYVDLDGMLNAANSAWDPMPLKSYRAISAVKIKEPRQQDGSLVYATKASVWRARPLLQWEKVPLRPALVPTRPPPPPPLLLVSPAPLLVSPPPPPPSLAPLSPLPLAPTATETQAVGLHRRSWGGWGGVCRVWGDVCWLKVVLWGICYQLKEWVKNKMFDFGCRRLGANEFFAEKVDFIRSWLCDWLPGDITETFQMC